MIAGAYVFKKSQNTGVLENMFYSTLALYFGRKISFKGANGTSITQDGSSISSEISPEPQADPEKKPS